MANSSLFKGYYAVTTKNGVIPIAMFLDEQEAISWSKSNTTQPIIELCPASPEFFQALLKDLGFPERLQRNHNRNIGQITKDVRIVPVSQGGQ